MPLGRATTLAIASIATTALTTTTALASGYAI